MTAASARLGRWFAFVFCLGWLWSSGAPAADGPEIRVGVLKFGTVNWELSTIRHHGLDQANGFRLSITPYGSPRATKVALLGNAVDVIVADWVWVSQQRAEGALFTFIPYSTSVGALMVPKQSPIHDLGGIAGARIGVAGGALDKSWLLTQAYLKQQGRADAVRTVEATFGAPPLLNQLLIGGELDGVITYWHFAARLEAAGMRRVIGISQVARALGVDAEVPLLGYIFRQDWAEENRTALLGFARASRQAKKLLAGSAEDWRRLRPLMRAGDDRTAELLRTGYLAGTPRVWGREERRQAGKLYRILAEIGGPAFSGGQTQLQPGTFWPAVAY